MPHSVSKNLGRKFLLFGAALAASGCAMVSRFGTLTLATGEFTASVHGG